jgi:hypothetical protein
LMLIDVEGDIGAPVLKEIGGITGVREARSIVVG